MRPEDEVFRTMNELELFQIIATDTALSNLLSQVENVNEKSNFIAIRETAKIVKKLRKQYFNNSNDRNDMNQLRDKSLRESLR